MRVIAGSAKRLLLKTVNGDSVRPTTDRIKETLFNMLGEQVYQCRFLDLFSGSGAIAIEALSRGADRATLVDADKRAFECMQSNLQHTNLCHKAELICKDAIRAIEDLKCREEQFDIVFIDPPYHRDLERRVLEKLQGSNIIHEDTLIILEVDIHTGVEYLSEMGYYIKKIKKYKTNQHVFVKIITDDETVLEKEGE